MASSRLPNSSKVGVRMDIKAWRSSDGDLAEIRKFLVMSHGPGITDEWVRAKFGDLDHTAVAALGYVDGIPAGMVAFGKVRYEYGGRRHDAAVSYDTFVAKQHRGVGAFKTLLRSAEALAEDSGAELFLNFPNHQSRRGFVSAGWTALSPARAYVAPTSVRAVRVMRDRRANFSPDKNVGPPREVPRGAAPPDVFQYEASAKQSGFRFARGRGDGYVCHRIAGSPVFLRVGVRGSLREAQLLALPSTFLTVRRLWEIRDWARRSCGVDLVSLLLASETSHAGQLLGAGFLPAGEVVVPYMKAGAMGIPQRYQLTGVDIHTW